MRLLTILTAAWTAAGAAAFAQSGDPPLVQSSSSFRLRNLVPTSGADDSTSTSFRARSILAETGTGETQFATSFRVRPGQIPALFFVQPSVPSTPSIPATLSSQTFTSFPILLDWGNSSHPDGILHYVLQVADDPSFGGGTIVFSSNPTASDESIASLSDGAYYWRVRAETNSFILSPFSRTATFFVTTVPQSPVTGPATAGGRTLEAYRMISIPAAAASGSGLDQLEQIFGPPNPAVWRLFFYNANQQQYVEYPDAGPHVPGRAYWLIAADSYTITFDGNETFFGQDWPVVLLPGWNMVGNPFESTSVWANCSVTDGVTTFAADNSGSTLHDPTLFAFDGTGYVSSTALNPFEGYWVFNSTSQSIVLFIDPTGGSKPGQVVEARTAPLKSGSRKPPGPPGSLSGGAGGSGGGGCWAGTSDERFGFFGVSLWICLGFGIWVLGFIVRPTVRA